MDVLTAEGIQAIALHGDLEQRDRDQVLIQFANRSCSVLVATDVAARGLDIAQLECVINVDVTYETEQHIHRIGRTGRAGEEGLALNLASMDEMGRVGNIEVLQKARDRVAQAVGAGRRRRQAADGADGDAADPRRPQGKDPPRRRAGRADQGHGLCRARRSARST